MVAPVSVIEMVDLRQKLKEKKVKFRAWGMKKNPFSIAPEPDAIVGMEEDITNIITCIAMDSGHILVTGEYGTGKTTLLNYLKDRLPEEYSVLYYARPPEPEDLYNDIDSSLRTWWGGYRASKVVIMVDEAHEMEMHLEKELRMLGDMKNVQVILSGIPELKNKLITKMPAFYDRIVNHSMLGIISETEAVELVKNRIAVSGGLESPLSEGEIRQIYRSSNKKARDVLKLLDRRLRFGKEERYENLFLPKSV
jgi:general secretion pathway protein A